VTAIDKGRLRDRDPTMQIKPLAGIALALLLTTAAAQAASETAGRGGVIPPDKREAFLAYIDRHHPPFSFIDSDGLKVGQVIRDTGIRYYKIPRGYGLRGYRFSVINNQVVLVEGASHRVVQIID
jgi:hypothetical protein